jgi:hypothetical protein
MLKVFRHWRIVPLFVAGVVLACVMGCGKDGEGKLVPVQGKVMVGDKPLTTGVVVFRPDAAKGNTSQHEPRGQIDAEGNYQLKTAQYGGAAPGWYKVGIITALPSTDAKAPYTIPPSLMPTIYNDPERSRLAVEVVEKPNPGAYDVKISK